MDINFQYDPARFSATVLVFICVARVFLYLGCYGFSEPGENITICERVFVGKASWRLRY